MSSLPTVSMSIPDDASYLSRIGLVAYMVSSIEWLVLGDMNRLAMAVPPTLTVRHLAGLTTRQIANALLNALPQVTDQSVRNYLDTGAQSLKEAGNIRNSILHARPATNLDEGQRLYRWHPDLKPQGEVFWIDNAFLDSAITRLDVLNNSLNAARPDFQSYPA